MSGMLGIRLVSRLTRESSLSSSKANMASGQLITSLYISRTVIVAIRLFKIKTTSMLTPTTLLDSISNIRHWNKIYSFIFIILLIFKDFVYALESIFTCWKSWRCIKTKISQRNIKIKLLTSVLMIPKLLI